MTTQFDLPAELTIYSAIETRDALLAWAIAQTAKSNSQLEVSAAAVTEVDGSGLQLLAALSNMDLTWKLIDASTAFSEACRTMGLADWLGNSHFKPLQAG
jgi:ABC-type transporter Mla MlaB component